MGQLRGLGVEDCGRMLTESWTVGRMTAVGIAADDRRAETGEVLLDLPVEVVERQLVVLKA
ncbi:hypothetical protein [Streptomyces hydrogenans]|uniref:hypothetical protein n=1 Tax=Streptomyces hydrogenans TaxID=1873719 RepID=UPI001CFE30AB|nr:hypothetical protein [Streptomyces hydrogenans]